jgi:antibiotic biosynthesis monooxygenase (ABM) superfamily enzyme
MAAKREGPTKVVVTLRPGKGAKAPRPPWKVQIIVDNGLYQIIMALLLSASSFYF